MNSIVEIKKDKVLVSSKTVAKLFCVEHRAVCKLISKYIDRFISKLDGILNDGEFLTPSIGRKSQEYWLNQDQFIFLATLMRNSDVSVAAKDAIVSDYSRVRKLLAELVVRKGDQKWLEARQTGKITRKDETDVIKKYIEYAKKQGSKSYNWYYVSLTKMQNAVLFNIDGSFKNIREMCDERQLMVLSVCDEIIKNTLLEGMKLNMPYKEIFKKCKLNMISFVEMHGRSDIVSMIQCIE